MYKLAAFTITISIFLTGCKTDKPEGNTNQAEVKAVAYNSQFNDYWYTGKAEVSSYELKQARYGEMRDGMATLIFVTEPFSKKKHVKLNYPDRAEDDKQTVMKLNFVKKFETGIYPYSMMLSSFTPVDQSPTMKVTMSGQEWCGHVFAQLNLEKKKYKVQSFSYFESEGDQDFSIDRTLLEDEVWNLIRLDYKALPTGEIKVTPGLFATRLMHQPLKTLNVKATLKETGDKATYTLNFENDRTLAITFATSFPHKILYWEETYKGLGGKTLTTSGKLKETLHIDYWNKNSTADNYLRDSLRLP